MTRCRPGDIRDLPPDPQVLQPEVPFQQFPQVSGEITDGPSAGHASEEGKLTHAEQDTGRRMACQRSSPRQGRSASTPTPPLPLTEGGSRSPPPLEPVN